MTEANKQKYNLIQQYLNGDLDASRMHELEREALEDPFLAEALEGFAEFDGSVQPHLSLLQRQLEARIAENAEKKNVFYFTWQRLSVAAAAGLLFVSASILFWMKGTNTEQRIAGNGKKVEVSLTPDDKLGDEAQTAEHDVQDEVLRTGPDLKTAPPQQPKEVRVQQKVLTAATTRNKKETPGEEVVTASLSENPPESEALVASVDGPLQEVVVGRASQASTSRVLTFRGVNASSPATAQPVGGLENYQAYINKNKRLPEPPGEAKSVTLIFTLDSVGRPTTWRVAKGIDENYNAEAIRLLKEGPLWKSADSTQQSTGSISVDFKN